MLGGNDKLNPSAHVVPIKQEVLELKSVQLDQEKQVEKGEGTPQVFTNKNVAASAPLQPVADNAPLPPVASTASIQVTLASPVTKESFGASPPTFLVVKDSETAQTEVGGRTECKMQELSCSVFPDADPSVVHTELISCERSVKSEKAETTDVGSAPEAETLHHHHAPQESHQDLSGLRDDTGDKGHVGSHVHWEHRDLNNITDQNKAQDLGNDRDQEQDFESVHDQDLESDQDFESEQHFSYIESDYDGERRSYEQCPARNLKVLGYGSVLCSVAIRMKYGIYTSWQLLRRV